MRDIALPHKIALLQPRVTALSGMIAKGGPDQAAALATLTTFLAEYKTTAGKLIGLRDDRLVTRKTAFDLKIRRAVEGNPKLGMDAAKVWDEVDAAYKKWGKQDKNYQLLEEDPAPGSALFKIARELVRGVPVDQDVVINEAVETAMLTQYLDELKTVNLAQGLEAGGGGRAAGWPWWWRTRRQAVAGGYPVRVRTWWAWSWRARRWAGYQGAESQGVPDRQNDRGIGSRHGEGIEARRSGGARNPEQQRRAGEVGRSDDQTGADAGTAGRQDPQGIRRHASARSKRRRRKRLRLIGSVCSARPTIRMARRLRVSHSAKCAATRTAPARRCRSRPRSAVSYYRKNNEGPYQVTKQWVDAKDKLDPMAALNFVSTADIGGGDYGSPVVNTAGELIGVTFDGNLESLPEVFLYTDEQARAVHVATQGITEALTVVYKAKPLLQELGIKTPAL